jgi:hypothetical protein
MTPRSLLRKASSSQARDFTSERPPVRVGPHTKAEPSAGKNSSTAQQLREVERRLAAIRRKRQAVPQEAGESGTATAEVQEEETAAGGVADPQPVAADKEVSRKGDEKEVSKVGERRETPEKGKQREAPQADEGKDDGEMRDEDAEDAEDADQVNRQLGKRKVSISTWSLNSRRCRPTQRWLFLRTRTTTTLAIRCSAISLTR